MLILYMQDGCAFSRKVRKEGEKLGLTIDERNIAEKAFEDELVAKGGKRETPYFVDEEYGVALYGSEEIIAHLRASYPKPTAL